MRRRQFVHGLAGIAAGALAARSYARPRPLRIAVIGGGIVGASIAMHLAEAGAGVLQFEKTAPAAGATRNSFAWLNAFVDDRHYQALRLDSIAAWHRLDRPLRLGIVWGGYLNWARDAAEAGVVRANAAQLEGTAFPTRSLSAGEFAALSPHIDPGTMVAALYSPMDGHVDPVQATSRFLDRARRRGARFVCPATVLGFQTLNGRLRAVDTSAGRYAIDRAIVAAGVDTPALLAMAGFKLELRHAPGFLAHSAPLAIQTRCICDAPGGVSFKQMADGSLVGTDSPDPPHLPVHAQILEHAVDFPDEAIRAMHGNRALGKIKAFLPGAQDAQLD
ncbi:MAG: FAD-binding oxidoreductase, partial [Proteobacteria bacterium]|nr:FAD-binding oxidoreductase [Pseudomonadota bacterium]